MNPQKEINLSRNYQNLSELRMKEWKKMAVGTEDNKQFYIVLTESRRLWVQLNIHMRE